MSAMKSYTDDQVRVRHTRVAMSRTFRNLVVAYGLGRKRVLDIGCGYGEYLRAFGQGSVGLTTTREEVAYGSRVGLDIREGNAEELSTLSLGDAFEAVWANNLFEHLLSPHAFLVMLKPHVAPNAALVLGVPIVLPSLFMCARRLRGALASNHIGFYTPHTLRLTVERAGWKVETMRPFFFENEALDRLCAPLAPHLYLVARNETSFMYPLKKLKEWQDDPRYASLLKITGQGRDLA